MGGYILLRCRTGLHDCLQILALHKYYAIKNEKTILLEFMMYKSTNLNDIFNFSNYPAKVILDTKPILQQLYDSNIETIPSIYKTQILDPKDVIISINHIGYFLYNDRVKFDLNINYPDNILPVYDNGFNYHLNYDFMLENINFNNKLIENFKKILFKRKYNAIHIRNTDRNNNYIKFYLMSIYKFINKSKLPVFLASDDINILIKLKNKYKDKILLSKTTYYNNTINNDVIIHQNGNLHQYGTIKSNVLNEAIYDLLFLACANNIIITCKKSGFSRLAKFLCENKEILNNLIK